MSAFDDDGQNGDVSWVHARYPCCLRQCLRLELFELLTAFKTDGRAGIVIKPGGNANGFILFGTRGYDFLLAYVTRVVLANPQLFDNGEHLPCREREFCYMVLHELMDPVKGPALFQVVDKRLSMNLRGVKTSVLNVVDRHEDTGCLLPDLGRKNADPLGSSHHSEAGIVLTENESTFCPAREHPVWLVSPLRDEIVDQNANVGILTAEDERFLTPNGKSGIDPRHNALRGGFLIPSRSIDLSSKVEPAYSFRFKRMHEFARIDSVIFNGIGVGKKLGMLKSWNGMNELLLNLLRQTV